MNCPKASIMFSNWKMSLTLLVLVAAIGQIRSEYSKLPDSIVPISYDVILNSLNFTTWSYSGTVQIEVKVMKDNLDRFVFHKGDYEVFSMIIMPSKSQGSVKPSRYPHEISANGNPEEVHVHLNDSKLKKGDVLSLIIKFENLSIRDDTLGFQKIPYFFNNTKEWLVITNSYPANARHLFPCFDEPWTKANVNLSVQIPKEYNAISNTKGSKSPSGNSTWIRFEQAQNISAQNVALAITKFASPACQGYVCIWTRPESVISFAQKIIEETLTNFEKLFGLKYPYKKLDIVAVPGSLPGSNANPGLILLPESALIFNADRVDASDILNMRKMINHALASIWLKSVVTPKSYDDIWISEGLLKFYEYFAPGRFDLEKMFSIYETRPALLDDSFENVDPLFISGNDPRKALEFNSQKGASLFEYISTTFGGLDKFHAAINTYINTGNHIKDIGSLLTVFDRELSNTKTKNVTSASVPWLMQPGYPVVNVKVSKKNVKLTQERFVLNTNKKEFKKSEWPIFVTLYDGKKTLNEIWLDNQKDVNISLPNKLLLVKSNGFYRVNYDNDSWDKIIGALDENNFSDIDVNDRSAIMDDLFNLARAGRVDYELVFDALEYLKHEKEFGPFKSVFKNLEYLFDKFAASEDKKYYKEFVQYLFLTIGPIYDNFGSGELILNTDAEILVRKEINNFACKFGYKLCVDSAMEYYSEFQKSPDTNIPNELRELVYCTGIQNGNEKQFNYLLQYLENETFPRERLRIARALGCAKPESIESSTSQVTSQFNDFEMYPNEKLEFLRSFVSQNPEKAEYALTWINRMYEALVKTFGGKDEVVSVIKEIANKYQTKGIVQKLESICSTPEHSFDGCADVLDIAKRELEWAKNNLAHIGQIFSDSRFPDPVTTPTTTTSHSTDSTPTSSNSNDTSPTTSPTPPVTPDVTPSTVTESTTESVPSSQETSPNSPVTPEGTTTPGLTDESTTTTTTSNVTVTTGSPGTSTKDPDEPTPSSSWKLWEIILVIIILLAVGLGGFFLYKKYYRPY